jgi:sugar/nucleoside kinase (ribokinase family)
MASDQAEVFCAGILVADLFAPPLPRLPDAGELLHVDDFLLTVGGCAANTAADLVKLGRSAAVAGKVGRDAAGDFVLGALGAHGIDATPVRRSAAPTSRTVILPVIGEDRRYIHAVGANADFTIDDVDFDRAAAARVLYVGGYLLLPGLAGGDLARLFAHARSRGALTVLDVAGVRPGTGLVPLAEVLPHTDVFLPNGDEAYALTGEQDPARQAEAFLGRGARLVAVTLGGDGAIVCTPNERLRAAAFPVNVVDPSGGGDAFDAGFIAGLLEGWDLRRTLAFASAVGASACTRLGCTDGVFTRAEADRFVAAHRLALGVY